MTNPSSFSVILDHPVGRVWETVRDFNSYPLWVNGVSESRIEEDLPGTTVGAVRDFVIAGAHTRQRLVAHSDVDRYFTYQSCGALAMDDGSGRTRTLFSYQGTLALRPVADGDRCFAEWSSTYACPHEDEAFWAHWWAASLPTWLESLRGYHDRSAEPVR